MHPSVQPIKSLTALGLDFLARTLDHAISAQYQLQVIINILVRVQQIRTRVWGIPLNAHFQVDHTTELDRYHLAASWSRVDTATTLLAQTGSFSGHGSTDTFNVNGGVTHDLGRIDTISWSASASTASSSDQSFTSYSTFPRRSLGSTRSIQRPR